MFVLPLASVSRRAASQRPFDRLFDESLTPAMDVIESDTSYTLHLDVPGVTREQLQVTIETTGFTTTIKIRGAKPNNFYKVQFCTLYNSCNDVGTATSNGSGDISASVDTRTQPGIVGTFALSDAAGFEYVAGFRVQ